MRWIIFVLAGLLMLGAAGTAVMGLESPSSLQSRRDACLSAAQEEHGRRAEATGSTDRFNPPPSCLDMSVAIDDDHAEGAVILLLGGIMLLVIAMSRRARVRPRPR